MASGRPATLAAEIKRYNFFTSKRILYNLQRKPAAVGVDQPASGGGSRLQQLHLAYTRRSTRRQHGARGRERSCDREGVIEREKDIEKKRKRKNNNIFVFHPFFDFRMRCSPCRLAASASQQPRRSHSRKLRRAPAPDGRGHASTLTKNGRYVYAMSVRIATGRSAGIVQQLAIQNQMECRLSAVAAS